MSQVLPSLDNLNAVAHLSGDILLTLLRRPDLKEFIGDKPISHVAFQLAAQHIEYLSSVAKAVTGHEQVAIH